MEEWNDFLPQVESVPVLVQNEIYESQNKAEDVANGVFIPMETVLLASLSTGYYLTQKSKFGSKLPLLRKKEDAERNCKMKLTRHNGRTGKHGAYNPKHNDRDFDVGNSDHSLAGMVQVYLDEYKGEYVCSLQLFQEALKNKFDKPKPKDLRDINDVMNKCNLLKIESIH